MMKDSAAPQTMFSTMAQCSAATNTPKNVLRLAKAKGAPGFVGYRVDWVLLEPWLKVNGTSLTDEVDDSLLKWKTKKARADAYKSEIELEELKKKYLLKEEVESQITAIALAQKNLLKSKLTQELPPKLLGLSVTEIAVEMERALQEICKLMGDLKV